VQLKSAGAHVRCRYMGLGSEWNDRWCVVMPRFPSVAAPANQQLTRSLLVVYKARSVLLIFVITHMQACTSVVEPGVIDLPGCTAGQSYYATAKLFAVPCGLLIDVMIALTELFIAGPILLSKQVSDAWSLL